MMARGSEAPTSLNADTEQVASQYQHHTCILPVRGCEREQVKAEIHD